MRGIHGGTRQRTSIIKQLSGAMTGFVHSARWLQSKSVTFSVQHFSARWFIGVSWVETSYNLRYESFSSLFLTIQIQQKLLQMAASSRGLCTRNIGKQTKSHTPRANGINYQLYLSLLNTRQWPPSRNQINTSLQTKSQTTCQRKTQTDSFPNKFQYLHIILLGLREAHGRDAN